MSLLSTAARTVADWVKLGYPEFVAKRIVSGDLPMDEASRLKRAEEQGYGDVLYHGSTHDIREFNGQGNPGNDWGEGTYLTDSTYDASTNYAGEGPDLTNRIESTKEQIQDEIRDRIRYSEDLNETLLDIQDEYGLDQHDMAKVRGWADESGLISYRGGKFMPDHPSFMLNDESENLLASALTSTIARKQVKGANEGVIYPVRVKQDGMLNVTDEVELPNYRAQAADDLGYDYDKYVNEDYDEDVLYEIEDRAVDLQWGDDSSPAQRLFAVGNDLDADMSQVETIHEGDTWNDVRNKLGGAVVETPDGEYIGSGGFLSRVMSQGGATGVVDDFAPSRFPSMGAGKHTIMFPGSENQIRSVNAAFDPEYTGPNILGGLALPATAGLLALAQSENADAGFVSRGGKTLLEAFHGSPHKFDKFSMDAIGTGEGAQVYGHGLYFADSEDVARSYRDDLTRVHSKDWSLGDESVPGWLVEAVDRGGADAVLSDLKRRVADAEMLIAEGTPQPWVREQQKAEAERMIRVVNRLASGEKAASPGHLYRTEIDVTPESLLDWDKPLGEQSEAVQDFMSRVAERAPFDGIVRNADGTLDPDASGKMLYEWLYGQKNGPDMTLRDRQANASRALSKNGIKGIKYLDGNSRHPVQAEADIANEIRDLEKRRELGRFMSDTDGVPDLSDSLSSIDKEIASRRAALKEMEDARQTSNYVIFDDSLINIAERGRATPGMMGAVAGTAGGASGIAALRNDVLNQLAAAKTVKERGDIRAPNSETLHKVTMAARDLERRLEGHPAGWLFPGGMLEYLEQANREERPSAMTRAMAFLDVL